MSEYHNDFKIGDKVKLSERRFFGLGEAAGKQGVVTGYTKAPETYEVLTDDKKHYLIVGNGLLRLQEDNK